MLKVIQKLVYQENNTEDFLRNVVQYVVSSLSTVVVVASVSGGHRVVGLGSPGHKSWQIQTENKHRRSSTDIKFKPFLTCLIGYSVADYFLLFLWVLVTHRQIINNLK